MQPCQIAVLTSASEFANIASVSVGKPAMISAPKVISGRSLLGLFGEADGIVAQMPPFHPLEDHIVAVLQGQVQMRHQARFGRDGLHQVLVHLDLNQSS